MANLKKLLLPDLPAIILLFGRYFDSIPGHRLVFIPAMYLANQFKL